MDTKLNDIPDKAVGELWRDALTWLSDSLIREQVLALIRKLVQVTGEHYFTGTDEQRTRWACERYGIDPATWPRE